ncbi:MAG: outer membrane lipoprotein chaperone LolA, partial [Gammaproteobacteria bacterium]
GLIIMLQMKLKRLSLVTCDLSLVTVFFLLLVTVFAVNAEELSTENRLDRFLLDLETFTADFEQTLYNEFGEELEVSGGTVYLAQPGKFHWAYETPYTQYLISNGKSLWIYDADLEQVTINTIDDAIEKSPASILTGDVDIEANYTVSDLGNDDGVDWIEVSPRDVNAQYTAIRLGFREQELSRMVLFDNLGQGTMIVFNNPERNTTLEESLFEFDPPEGVDIIDSREQ